MLQMVHLPQAHHSVPVLCENGSVGTTAAEEGQIRYVQFARILLYWTGFPHLVGQLGLRSKG